MPSFMRSRKPRGSRARHSASAARPCAEPVEKRACADRNREVRLGPKARRERRPENEGRQAIRVSFERDRSANRNEAQENRQLVVAEVLRMRPHPDLQWDRESAGHHRVTSPQEAQRKREDHHDAQRVHRTDERARDEKVAAEEFERQSLQ